MVTAFVTKFRHFTLQFRYVLISLVLLNISPLFCLAQDRHSHASRQQELTPQQKSKTSALVTIVRESTERFKNVHVAEKGGYVLQFSCASERGPATNRGPRLIGADILVVTKARDRRNPPESIEAARSLFRIPQSLRSPDVLHAACPGVEGQSKRGVGELALQRFVRTARRPNRLGSRRQ